ncbi:M15 family metallopeptidase [Prevotella sp. OH937_COT-195]|uniref:M15 family metallopeptidase n=1 Tax=Prevotella sp. OH937_COT-195 TaxID=2491051 RepID=UPI000F64826C|nr:M15 family metallopeptidase [Prevotella sp. OH937_COT-195]RRD00334.1 M15 family peptidase [Prevotella sp. OH937_COT-195]
MKKNTLFIATFFITTVLLTGILLMAIPLKSEANKPRIRLLHDWEPGLIIDETDVNMTGLNRLFLVCDIDNNMWERINGKSWRKGCPVGRRELCYLRLLHRNAKGQIQTGEMVVNRKIAERVTSIFKELYLQNYRIESIFLVDNYGGDDEKSMAANNTSCFNYRRVEGSAKLSKHAYGMAIDINPKYNPYVRGKKVSPENGRKYAFNREVRKDIPYEIDRNDMAYKLFTKAGATWGGNWKTMKDYQHFQFPS